MWLWISDAERPSSRRLLLLLVPAGLAARCATSCSCCSLMRLDTGLPLIEAPNQSTVYQALSHDAGGTSTAHILMVSFSAAGTKD